MNLEDELKTRDLTDFSSLSFAIQLSKCICILTWKLDEDTVSISFYFQNIFYFVLGHVTCDVKRNK